MIVYERDTECFFIWCKSVSGYKTFQHINVNHASWEYFNIAASHTAWVSQQSSTGCISRVWQWRLNRRKHPQLHPSRFIGCPECQLVWPQRQGGRSSGRFLSTWRYTIVYNCTTILIAHNKEVPILVQNYKYSRQESKWSTSRLLKLYHKNSISKAVVNGIRVKKCSPTVYTFFQVCYLLLSITANTEKLHFKYNIAVKITAFFSSKFSKSLYKKLFK
jgi:hypothetical protein